MLYQDPHALWSFVRDLLLVGLLWQPAAAQDLPVQDESLLFPSQGVVYAATVRGGVVDVQPLSAPTHKVDRLVGGSSWETLWVVGESTSKNLTTISYPAFKVRVHPRALPPANGGALALSPDGGTLAYLGWEESSPVICCEDLGNGNVRTLSGNWKWLTAPSWSPDGKMIAVYTSEHQDAALRPEGGLCLTVVDVNSGRAREIGGASQRTRGPTGAQRIRPELRYPPVWSPAGDRVFFEARYRGDPPDRFVYQGSLEPEQKPIRVTTGLCVSASSDALYVQDYRSESDNGIYVVKPGPRAPERQLLVKGGALFPRVSPSGKRIAYYQGAALNLKSIEGPSVDTCLAKGVAGWAALESSWAPGAPPVLRGGGPPPKRER
jgi:hypothetical protein